MNVLNFTGHIGSDAEIRYTAAGKPITSFSVALTSGYGDKKATTWMRCTIFGERGPKLQPYLLKGALVGVSGEFSAREWENKDGVTKTSCEVNVNDVTLLSKPAEGDSSKQGMATARAAVQPAIANAVDCDAGFADLEDIPFSNYELKVHW